MKALSIIIVYCLMVIGGQAQERLPAPYPNTIKYNIIRTWDAQAPITDPTVLISKGYKDVKQSMLYADGLGRPVQAVVRQGSQITDSTARDLVSPILYDNYGREVYQYLPFAANNTGGNTAISNGAFKYNAFQQDSAFQKTQFPGETYYYSKKIYEPSPLARVMATYTAGNSWAGSESNPDPNLRRSVAAQQKINTTADSVRTWTVNGTSFTTTAIFGANQLFKQVSIDEHKKQTIEYKNKEGQVLLKKVQLSDSPSSGHYGWLCTYYIYDHLDRLRLVVQPRGVELLMANAWNITALSGDILNEQCFRYEYDSKGRMTIQKVPGAAEVWKVYDARDRVVLQQDGNLRLTNKWTFTKYDAQNRPVMTGFYRNTTQITQATMQAFLNAQNLGLAENYPTASFPYYSLDLTFPVVGDTALLTVAWFDNYNWAAGFSGFESKEDNFDALFPAASNSIWPYHQPLSANTTQTVGLPTGSWDKSAVGLVNAIFYDDYGRVIQTKSRNITNGIDIITNQYSFNGHLLQTVLWHHKNGTNENAHIVITKYEYDDLWRLLTTKQRISSTINGSGVSSDEQVIVSNQYNALGQLVKKKLGNKPEVSGEPLSNLSYEYNIRGWLTTINKDYLTASTNNDLYFAMQLGYDKNGALGNFSPQFNGNIGGTIWKNESDQRVRKYDFTYDASNRITSANFNQYVSGTGSSAVFDRSAGLDFSLTSMSYDANGNILSMNQKGWKLGGSHHIDSLKYNYYNNGNRLKNVIDAVNDTTTRLGDFRSSKAYMTALGNNKTAAGTDYTYDASGNMNKDRNKDIEDVALAGIEYNHLNLPVRIRVKNKGTIEYTYDNGGNKLSKTVTEGTIVTNTLYIAGFEYRNDTLQQLMHTEGRVRLEQPTINTCPVLPLRYVYDYFLKDHLGNVRMVLTEEQPSDCYLAATVEEARVANEEKIYHIVPARIIAKATTGATQASFENKLYRTHGGLANEKTGLAIVLKVMAGDRVAIRGESFYSLPGGNAGTPLTLGLVELLTSFVGSNASALKGVSATTDITGISGNPAALTSFVNSSSPATNTAKAAVNYILFDEQFKYVSGDFDGVVTGGGYKNHVKFVNAPVTASKSGYLYIYVSNESNLPVYFDNLQVTHTRGPIVETNDYYPFGLGMAGISSKVLKANYVENRFKFNEGTELNSTLEINLYETQRRLYDPQIGKFVQVDAIAEAFEDWSPYTYAFNNPVLFNDPTGLAPSRDTGVNDIKEMAPVEVVAKAPKRLDTENGQVYPSLPWWSYIFGSDRMWNGYQVDNEGYVRKYFRVSGTVPDFGMKKAAVKAGAKITSKYLIYRATKRINGQLKLYIGKAKNALSNRYTKKELVKNGAEVIDKLNALPDNATALGVEQAIIELNGGLEKLSNIKNAAVKEIYTKAGIKWLNENIPNWQEIFKFQ